MRPDGLIFTRPTHERRRRCRRVPRSLPYLLALYDDTVQIGVGDDTGMLRALIETDSVAVRRWAEDVYADSLELSASRSADVASTTGAQS